jgi:glycosyltransferase involved in cell wall biosynthesis
MSNRIFLDVSDVVEYFSSNMTASGIQRVQLEFIRVFAEPGRSGFEFVIESKGETGFTLVDRTLLLRLVVGIDAGSFKRKDLTALLLLIRSASTLAQAAPGDIFFISGAFWASSTATRALWSAKERGARVGFLCYDLIPIRQPEFCDEGLARLFRGAFASICHVTDFIFTISVHVKHDVEAYLALIGLQLPVIALPLAHELAPMKGDGAPSARARALTAKPYVLFVSTIEGRKNHIYALTVWQRLMEREPDLVPDMIWVGRPGWLVSDLMERVRRLDHLGGKLKIVNNLTDVELRELYRCSLFSFYPSLVEGWGLPVAESLMFGKTSVSSRTTSLPEVGGDFVFYIDPDNVTDGVETVLKLLRDPALVQAMEERIRTSFRPRLWRNVCDDLVAGLKRIETTADARRALPMLRTTPGRLYGAGSDATGASPLSLAEQAGMDGLFDQGWYAAEAWGRWLRGVDGGIWLELDNHDEPRPYIVMLKLQMIDGWRGRSVSLFAPDTGEEAIFRAQHGRAFWVCVRVNLAGGRRRLVLRADRMDGVPGPDPRRFSAGLILFGFAPADNAAAVAALEQSRTDADRPPRRLSGEPAAGGSPDPKTRPNEDPTDRSATANPTRQAIQALAIPVPALPVLAINAPPLIEVTAARIGPQSGLRPRKVLIDSDDWRLKLIHRAWSEGPLMFTARILSRTARWLARGRLG